MMEIKILENENIFASFTTRCTKAFLRRNALAKQAESFGGTVAWPHLVHESKIAVLGKEALGKGLLEIPDTDGCITNIPGICLTVTCGDCLPVYIYDPVNKAIGLAHAGWRGTLKGIAAELVLAMQRSYKSKPEDLIAVVGPGISACCFEVKSDTYEPFTDKYPWAEEFLYRKDDGSFTLDLKGINLEILQLSGVEKLSASSYCTFCDKGLFYSWRRSKDKERMLAYCYLKPSFLPSLAISQCLMGEKCRYDGKSKPHKILEELKKKYYLVPVCPECLGGLPTPRNASEIKDGKVIMKVTDPDLLKNMSKKEHQEAKLGELLEVTEEYKKGAEAAFSIMKENGAEKALLKSKSPSCGIGKIYDGNFSRTLTKGNGIFAELLKKENIEIINSDEN